MVFTFLLCTATIVLSITLNKAFSALDLVQKYSNGNSLPYSGGTIILLSIGTGLYMNYKVGEISLFKLIFFLLMPFMLYAFGILEDIFGEDLVRFLNRYLNFRFDTVLKLIKFSACLGISSCAYYYFSEEYWFLKGMITALVTALFNTMKKESCKVIKSYYFIFFMLSTSELRWNKEIYIITLIVISSFYYFETSGRSALGESGSSLIGFISGLMICEALSISLVLIVLTISVLISGLIIRNYSLQKLRISKSSSVSLLGNIISRGKLRISDK